MNGPQDWYRTAMTLGAVLADVLTGELAGYTHTVTMALESRADTDVHAAGALRVLRTEMIGRQARCECVLYREGFEPLKCVMDAGHRGDWHTPANGNESGVVRWRYTEQGEPIVNNVRAFNGADAEAVTP